MKFNEQLAHISTYEAGKPIEEVVRRFGIKEQDIIKLASNENPYGSSQAVIKALQTNAHKASLYPDDSMIELKEGLAKRFDVALHECIIGAGSDQIIEFCFHAKANKDSKILVAGVTFAMYEIYAKHIGATIIKTPSGNHNIQEFKEYYAKYKPDIVFLCVPNNPLGECLESKEVFEFIDGVDSDTLVVIDGAYQEFAAYKDKAKEISPKKIVSAYENVIYLGTFSKAYGLGGMRVGYGIANQNIITALYKIRPPFNITTLSLVAAIQALKDKEFVQKSIANNFIEMKHYEKFAKDKNIEFIPSFTNFITLKFDNNYDSNTICDTLLQQGIIIRNLKSYHINAIRITIGTPNQNTRLLEILDTIIKQ